MGEWRVPPGRWVWDVSPSADPASPGLSRLTSTQQSPRIPKHIEPGGGGGGLGEQQTAACRPDPAQQLFLHRPWAKDTFYICKWPGSNQKENAIS